MPNNSFVKDPQAKLDYRWDWTAWLAESEIITSATVTVPAGLTLVSNTYTSTDVTAFIQGGTVDEIYTVMCHIETNQNRIDERSITIQVAQL